MIARLKGSVVALAPDSAVLDVAGVGLLVHCGPNLLAGLRIGESAQVFTSLVVREDSLTLYGFGSDDERCFFELLQTASGVGPRVAQAVLAVHTPDDVRRAIAGGDTAALTQVSGIGKKGAERLILELKDRIGPIGAREVESGIGGSEQVIAGLVALGWSAHHAEQAAERAAQAVRSEKPESEPEVATVLKRAIQLLGRA